MRSITGRITYLVMQTAAFCIPEDFAGKEIALPQMKENYPGERFVEWHKREVFRGGH